MCVCACVRACVRACALPRGRVDPCLLKRTWVGGAHAREGLGEALPAFFRFRGFLFGCVFFTYS